MFAERVREFEPDLVVGELSYPAVVTPIEYYRPIAVEEIRFLRARTQRRVKKERIILHPDCGFSPSVQNPMDLDEAYLKLRAMCSASALLRDRWN